MHQHLLDCEEVYLTHFASFSKALACCSATRSAAARTRSARGYKKGSHIRDAHRLRMNAYRVLLTRGRDGTILFVPKLAALDESWDYLAACGVKALG